MSDGHALNKCYMPFTPRPAGRSIQPIAVARTMGRGPQASNGKLARVMTLAVTGPADPKARSGFRIRCDLAVPAQATIRLTEAL